MSTPEIIRLARGEQPEPILIGRVPQRWASHLGSSSRWVYLSPYSVGKQISRHPDFTLDQIEDVEWVFENGKVVLDRMDNVIHFIADTRGIRGKWTRATVKRDRRREVLFLISAFWVRERDYQRMIRNETMLKN